MSGSLMPYTQSYPRQMGTTVEHYEPVRISPQVINIPPPKTFSFCYYSERSNYNVRDSVRNMALAYNLAVITNDCVGYENRVHCEYNIICVQGYSDDFNSFYNAAKTMVHERRLD